MLAFGPTLIAGAAAVIGTAGAATSWLVNYKLRDEHFARSYVAQMTERLEQQRKETMQKIGRDLEKLGMPEAYSQYTRVSDKYALYKKTLSNNLHTGELTYSRYLGTGEQVYLSILDNLSALIHAKQSADGIDEIYIRQRINNLQDHNDHHAQEELKALNKRLQLKQSQLNHVAEILSENEIAMTQLDLAITAVADLGNATQQTSVDLESAVAELARLAKRTEDYS